MIALRSPSENGTGLWVLWESRSDFQYPCATSGRVPKTRWLRVGRLHIVTGFQPVRAVETNESRLATHSAKDTKWCSFPLIRAVLCYPVASVAKVNAVPRSSGGSGYFV